MYMATIAVIGAVRPGWLPAAPRSSWRERLQAMREVWAPLLLFVFVIGGLYGGLFTPTEAGGMGAGGAFLISVARGRLSRADMLASLLQATRTAAAVFTVLIGAILFGYFLTVTQTPQKVTEFITGLGFGRYGALVLIMLMYLVLGCLMDAMAMIILTVPIIFPVITALGFDPVWFGVIIVMTVELGLIHPPVGMNVFVIKTVVQDVDFTTIFYGVHPVRRHRHHAAGDPDRVPGAGTVPAEPHVVARMRRRNAIVATTVQPSAIIAANIAQRSPSRPCTAKYTAPTSTTPVPFATCCVVVRMPAPDPAWAWRTWVSTALNSGASTMPWP